MSKIVLTYFNIPGRAEPIRIALWNAGVAFEDKRLDFAAWGAAKPTTPGGSLPIVEIDGKVYTQSNSIARWAAKKGSLYPKDDLEALRCDEILDIGGEIMSKTPSDKDEAKKKALREEFSAGWMKGKTQLLESYAKAAGGNFICGKDVTLADFIVKGYVEMVQGGSFDYVPATYMDEFPNLVAIAKKTAECDLLKKYTEATKK